ncbi:MAG: histidinol-phosphatase [Oscillospiraceae bacterium]|nr:histidinol-phosphatase [Oscillospiraceae bacterium]
MILSNLHTHTIFSDGKDTPEKMVEVALARGFWALGFSDHAFSPNYAEGSMPPERFEAYKDEIRRLKLKYFGRIRIYLGIENESLYPFPSDGLDYVIGSVHDVPIEGGVNACVDATKLAFHEGADYLGGDTLKLVELYYQTLANMIRTQRPDIVGHFDLPTKLNEKNDLFDMRSKRYQKAVMPALDALAAEGLILEINTGAMGRGLRSDPYPAPWILRECLKRGVRVTVSSDAHSADMLDFEFDEMEYLLRGLGYTETWQLTNGGFTAVPIE